MMARGWWTGAFRRREAALGAYSDNPTCLCRSGSTRGGSGSDHPTCPSHRGGLGLCAGALFRLLPAGMRGGAQTSARRTSPSVGPVRARVTAFGRRTAGRPGACASAPAHWVPPARRAKAAATWSRHAGGPWRRRGAAPPAPRSRASIPHVPSPRPNPTLTQGQAAPGGLATGRGVGPARGWAGAEGQGRSGGAALAGSSRRRIPAVRAQAGARAGAAGRPGTGASSGVAKGPGEAKE